MFAGYQIYDVKSRGVAKNARIKLTESDIRWADLIIVMKKTIMIKFRKILVQ